MALVVSASINWGKRCPHFLAETRPPFFATSLRANGKNGHARRRGKNNTFFSRPHLSSSGHRRRNLTVSPLSPARRVTTKRGKRETVRGDARVDVRVFFLLGSGPSREKSRVPRKSRHSRRRSPARHPPRSASSSAEARRWSSSRRASDRARVPLAQDAFDAETHPLRRLFWNKSSSPTEVSKRAGLIAFVPHRGVSSFRRLSRKRHARQSDKNGKSTRSSRSCASSDGSVERALEATRGRPRRRLRLPRFAPPPPPCGRK